MTHGPKHHMFGFHDLVQTNAAGDMALGLEIDDVSRPPLPREFCQAGVLDLDQTNCQTDNFIPLHKTHAWNYPQGARQQWFGETDICLCNDRANDGQLICQMYDARRREHIEALPFPVHCINAAANKAVIINYDRLYSCGVYGYVPFDGKNIKLLDFPEDDGLWIGDLKTGEKQLVASIRQIASCGVKKLVKTGFPHYVTHPLLNPSGTRIVFLHRYRVLDGGETSRLMTVGLDGSKLRCLSKGFLSHFTWLSDDELFIWGAHQPGLSAMREAQYLRIPGILQCARLAKGLIRAVRGGSVSDAATSGKIQSKAFLLIKDSDCATIEKRAIGTLTEDGHPMARPGNPRVVVSDTYPDVRGDRQLYIYDVDKNERVDIGVFRRIFEKPDVSKFSVKDVQRGTDPRIVKRFDLEHYLFARSGLHCDLHPRWSHDGNSVWFDSIHEGTRQLYTAAIS
jgi:hypothetical protein